jgi:hypothetical protein
VYVPQHVVDKHFSREVKAGMVKPISAQQIGKCGELLIQYKLLLRGIESALLTTDTGIDLVAYSPRKREPVTIQVKTNLKAKPGGGRGKMALDWWVDHKTPADIVALTDLASENVWLFTMAELRTSAQQSSGNRYHFYMYTDLSVKPRKGRRPSLLADFADYLLERRRSKIF